LDARKETRGGNYFYLISQLETETYHICLSQKQWLEEFHQAVSFCLNIFHYRYHHKWVYGLNWNIMKV